MSGTTEPTVFERIAAGEIPARMVAETDRVIAFHDQAAPDDVGWGEALPGEPLPEGVARRRRVADSQPLDRLGRQAAPGEGGERQVKGNPRLAVAAAGGGPLGGCMLLLRD